MKARDTSRQIHGDTATIVRQAKSNELKSTHRVYVKEWLPEIKSPSEGTVRDYFEHRYEGRIRDEDVEFGYDEEQELHYLNLRLWNVKAEWKDEALALAHAAEIIGEQVNDQTPDVEVVARNSRKEHLLASYGKLKLPVAK